jgi:hypothetical protein
LQKSLSFIQIKGMNNMSGSIFDKTYTVKQLLNRFGIFLLIAIPIYIFMMFKYAWEYQYVNSNGPFKWDKKITEVCSKTIDPNLTDIDTSKVEFDLGQLLFKPATRYRYSVMIKDNPECLGFVIRQGLYGGKDGNFRSIYVNKKFETVAEITVIYTDKKDD